MTLRRAGGGATLAGVLQNPGQAGDRRRISADMQHNFFIEIQDGIVSNW